MPLYEYECTKCGHRFEKIQKVSDRAPKCVRCGGKVRQLIHPPAVQFKGSGWYVTDYARKGAAGESKSGEAKAGEAKSGEAKPGGKSETKGKHEASGKKDKH